MLFIRWIALLVVAVGSLGIAEGATAPEAKPMLLPMPREYSARGTVSLAHTDAIDAIDLGARKFDFIGQKFETADAIAKGL